MRHTGRSLIAPTVRTVEDAGPYIGKPILGPLPEGAGKNLRFLTGGVSYHNDHTPSAPTVRTVGDTGPYIG